MSLQGTLKTLGITEVLEFMSTRSASGRLDVTTEMGTASYGLVDGVVVDSEYSFIRESGTDAAEATYYVVSELDGVFFFDDDRVPEPSDDGEDIPSLLSRTAEIAERWIEVEQTVPSPNHLLTRNNELDGSVMIQPEWWKALEMIGNGRTSLQLASALGLSALDASLTALAMTKAGLLIVREVDPLEIEVDSGFGPIEEPPAQDDHYEAPEAAVVDAGFAFEHRAEEAEEYETSPPLHDVEPVQMLGVVEVDDPTPVSESSWESAAPMSFASSGLSTPETVETPMSFSNPALSSNPATEPGDHTVPDEFAGRSGMDDLSELEYMLEPDGFVSGEHPVHTDAPSGPREQDLDDDGWSNGHVATHTFLQPMTSAPPASVPPQAPVAEVPVARSPFDTVGVPGEAPAPVNAPEAPVLAAATEMSFEDLPAPPIAPQTFDGGSAPVPEAAAPAPVPAAEDINAATTAMAGEVIEDLASLTDELDESIDAGANWQLDGTFVPESNPAPAAVQGDPFSDLGDLLNDTPDDERGSVLKFLRRD